MLGLKVIVSVYAVKDGEPIIHRRSWRQRLFSWPWRPWVTTWTEIPKVPAFYVTKDSIIAHPAALMELRKVTG
jgi:hypothetical protein